MRGKDGSVTIEVNNDFRTFTAAEWARVVASVSAHGDTPEAYKYALEFHG